MGYKIYVSEDDEEGKDVSALDMYKFLQGKREGKIRAPTKGKSKELVPYGEGWYPAQIIKRRSQEHQEATMQGATRDLETS